MVRARGQDGRREETNNVWKQDLKEEDQEEDRETVMRMEQKRLGEGRDKA
jgi:hypothetical protein